MGYDYALETKLSHDNPQLHQIFSDNAICCQNMLNKYQSLFPAYTDHTCLHSLEVIAFCNELVGKNIGKLNCDEIFVLLMAAYLHDSGMGISASDLEAFSDALPMAKQFRKAHPEAPISEVVRRFHHEFSGKYIEKYAFLFDFPSEEHLWAVMQVSRGHRKTDLYDDAEYPAALQLPNGNVIHLPYLASLIRLADELDIAADRNICFLYDNKENFTKHDYLEFARHTAIRQVEFGQNAFDVTVECEDPEVLPGLVELFAKLEQTLLQCVDVAQKRTPFEIYQKEIRILGCPALTSALAK